MDSPGSTPAVQEPVGVEDRVAAIEVLRFVLAKWLTVHCPAAKANIAACLLPPPPPGQQQVQQRERERRKEAAATPRVVVETMAGVVVGSFECDPATTTIAHLRLLVAEKNPAMPSRCQRLFLTGSTQILEPKATLAECGVFAAGCGGGAGGGKLVVVLANDPRWDPLISNKTLEFSLQNRQVRRPGSTSSYPCARANFLLERVGDSFCVHIETLESVNNGLTIGVLAKGHAFKNESSNGVGGEDGTAGLHISNVRIRMGRKNKRVALLSRRQAMGPPMAMVEQGDRLRFTVRTGSQPRELVLALSVNDEHFFDIPLEGLPLPLRPLCTLPDNCRLELEP